MGGKRVDASERIALDRQTLRGEAFSGRQLLQFVAVGSRLEACRFDNSHIKSGSFGAGREVSEHRDCSFDRARIDFGPAGFTRFVNCSFLDAHLSDWFCFAVELVNCTFSGRLSKAFFNGSLRPEDADIVGRDRNEFSGKRLF